MTIYLIENKLDGMYYVGQTTVTYMERWKKHLYNARHGVNTYLYSAMRKYGVANFKIYPLMTEITTREELDRWEVAWIAAFRSQDPEYGYNLTSGGSSNSTVSESTREKMRLAATGRKASDETKTLIGYISSNRSSTTKLKMSQTKLGKKATPETKLKMSITRLGRKMPEGFAEGQRQRMLGTHPTEETRKKLSESHKTPRPWRVGKKLISVSKASPETCLKRSEYKRKWWALKKAQNEN